jgi:hypothetical protein
MSADRRNVPCARDGAGPRLHAGAALPPGRRAFGQARARAGEPHDDKIKELEDQYNLTVTSATQLRGGQLRHPEREFTIQRLTILKTKRSR